MKRVHVADEGDELEICDPQDIWRKVFEALRTKDDVTWLLSEPWPVAATRGSVKILMMMLAIATWFIADGR